MGAGCSLVVCSPGVPGPRGTAAPQQLLGRGKESQAGAKATLLPRAREGVKVTENGDGNGNK